MCVCVCVCVCVTERHRETHKERETQAEIEKNREREKGKEGMTAWIALTCICCSLETQDVCICSLVNVFAFICVHAKSLQSCLTLYDAMDCCPPDSSVHGVLQARILEWIACPPPGDLPGPGIEPAFPAASALQVDSLPLSHWEAPPYFIHMVTQRSPSAGRGVVIPPWKPWIRASFVMRLIHLLECAGQENCAVVEIFFIHVLQWWWPLTLRGPLGLEPWLVWLRNQTVNLIEYLIF